MNPSLPESEHTPGKEMLAAMENLPPWFLLPGRVTAETQRPHAHANYDALAEFWRAAYDAALAEQPRGEEERLRLALKGIARLIDEQRNDPLLVDLIAACTRAALNAEEQPDSEKRETWRNPPGVTPLMSRRAPAVGEQGDGREALHDYIEGAVKGARGFVERTTRGEMTDRVGHAVEVAVRTASRAAATYALTTERHRRESAERERDEQIEVVNGLGEKLDAERHRTQVVEGERDEQKRINEFDIGVANAELREDCHRLREALRQMIRVTELPGTRSELAPETERAKSAARSALAASQEET